MVIGLNGRIPLNTAGNLAGQRDGIPFPFPPSTYTYGGGAAHAAHLGNSVSEIDPTYALQNGYDPNLRRPRVPSTIPRTNAYNTQVDNAGIDVRLTQLRNLLAGTRPRPPQRCPASANGRPDLIGLVNGDDNCARRQHPLPHAQRRRRPQRYAFGTDASNVPASCARRRQLPAGGARPSRYRAESCPGFPSPPAINNYVNLVHANYVNSVRAGYSYDISRHPDHEHERVVPRRRRRQLRTRLTPTPRDTPASSTTRTTTMRPGR